MKVSLWLALAALVVLSRRADAQETDFDQPAISVERLWVEPGAGRFVAAADASVLPVGDMHLGFLASLMSRPLVLKDLRSGEDASVPVALRLGYELHVARGVTRKLQLGVALPMIAAQDGDRLQEIGLSEEYLDSVAIGDVRLHAKLALQDDARKPYRYGASIYLALPTGDDHNFAGERGAVIGWTLLGSYRFRNLHLAANLGVRLRTAEVILLSPARPHGNELLVTLAARYDLPRSLVALPVAMLAEVTKVEGDDGGASPGEWRAGLALETHTRFELRAVAGRGFTPDEVGSPRWRVAVLGDFAL